MTMFDQALFDRLESRVLLDPVTGCKIWQGQTDGKEDPYGRVSYKGQTIGAHIAMWKAVFGKIRKGYDVDHGCNVRLCIEYTHLKPVTKLKNQRLRQKRSKYRTDALKCLEVRR
jgi:hypothetical protein